MGSNVLPRAMNMVGVGCAHPERTRKKKEGKPGNRPPQLLDEYIRGYSPNTHVARESRGQATGQKLALVRPYACLLLCLSRLLCCTEVICCVFCFVACELSRFECFAETVVCDVCDGWRVSCHPDSQIGCRCRSSLVVCWGVSTNAMGCCKSSDAVDAAPVTVSTTAHEDHAKHFFDRNGGQLFPQI